MGVELGEVDSDARLPGYANLFLRPKRPNYGSVVQRVQSAAKLLLAKYYVITILSIAPLQKMWTNSLNLFRVDWDA